jgi:hypothetical protein
MVASRFRGEISHFSIYLIRFGSEYSWGRGTLVWKLSYCKIWKYFGSYNLLKKFSLEFIFSSCSLASDIYFVWCRISSWCMYVRWLLILSSIHSLLNSMTLSPLHILSSLKTYVNRYFIWLYVDIMNAVWYYD